MASYAARPHGQIIAPSEVISTIRQQEIGSKLTESTVGVNHFCEADY